MAKLFFILFQIILPILLLNMLIAMMGNTYAIVNEKSEKEFLKQVRSAQKTRNCVHLLFIQLWCFFYEVGQSDHEYGTMCSANESQRVFGAIQYQVRREFTRSDGNQEQRQNSRQTKKRSLVQLEGNTTIKPKITYNDILLHEETNDFINVP